MGQRALSLRDSQTDWKRLGEEGTQKELLPKWSRSPCRMLGKDQTSGNQSWERFIPLAHSRGCFYSFQRDVPCLPTLLFPYLSLPSPDAQHSGATLGSACPGIHCGGEPDGQRCLTELPPSSLPSHSHSCLGRCLCPVLLSGLALCGSGLLLATSPVTALSLSGPEVPGLK